MRITVLQIVGLFFGISSASAADQEMRLPPNFPWEVASERIFKLEGLDNHICGGDENGNLICFDFVWREGKFELMVTVALLYEDGLFFRDEMVPEFIINGELHGIQNKLLGIDRFLGADDFPYHTSGRAIYWRVSVGSPLRIASTEKGIYFKLRRAESLAIRYYFSDGSEQVVSLPTENLSDGLEAIFEEAALMESVYGDYEDE